MKKILSDASSVNAPLNLIPKDGQVEYLPAVFDKAHCSELFDALRASLQWETEQFRMFGRLVITRRKVAWVGDPACSYSYSGIQKTPQPWTVELMSIKERIEALSKWKFNSCLLNLYHDGSEGMGWHSDDEPSLNSDAPIVSLSLGGARKFSFRHKQDRSVCSVVLENGSVLIMRPPTQKFWKHSLLKTKTDVTPRINLTFRTIILDK